MDKFEVLHVIGEGAAACICDLEEELEPGEELGIFRGRLRVLELGCGEGDVLEVKLPLNLPCTWVCLPF